MVIVNLEQGRPTVEVALIRLRQSIDSARFRGVKSIKLIHGYGSSGKGGAIRKAVLQELRDYQEAGLIRCFVRGDEFSLFNAGTREAIRLCPELRQDSDYDRCNQGVSFIVL